MPFNHLILCHPLLQNFFFTIIYFDIQLGPDLLDSLVAQMVKSLPAMQETWLRSLGWEDPLEKEIATHSSIIAWKIPWTEEPGRLQPTGLQRVGHDCVTSLWSWFGQQVSLSSRLWSSSFFEHFLTFCHKIIHMYLVLSLPQPWIMLCFCFVERGVSCQDLDRRCAHYFGDVSLQALSVERAKHTHAYTFIGCPISLSLYNSFLQFHSNTTEFIWVFYLPCL